MKKILVLGANGFIGQKLCSSLAKTNHVIAYDLKFSSSKAKTSNLEFVQRNFVDDDFSDLLENVDLIYHLISTTLPQERTDIIPEEISNNVIPTVRLLEMMKNTGVKNIIFASSGGTVYGESGEHRNRIDDKLVPICSYGVQKKVIEAYLEFYGIRYSINYRIARISNPYGLGQNISRTQGVVPIFIRRLLNNESIVIYGDGESKRDYLYMDDLIDAMNLLGNYSGEQRIFNIASGESHSLNEIVKIVQDIGGKKFKEIIYYPVRNFDVSNNILDINNTTQELGWKSQVNIYEGIKRIYSLLKERSE